MGWGCFGSSAFGAITSGDEGLGGGGGGGDGFGEDALAGATFTGVGFCTAAFGVVFETFDSAFMDFRSFLGTLLGRDDSV